MFGFGKCKENRSQHFLRQLTEFSATRKSSFTVLYSSHVTPESTSYLLLVTQEYEF
jgi:hypothetical protein